jgi:hypothetical protein
MNPLLSHRFLLAGALLVSAPVCHAQQAGTLSKLPINQATAPTESPEIIAARAALLSGVKEVSAPGLPGVVAVSGARAFPVLLGMAGSDKNRVVAPAVAAAFTPKGGIVALGHDGMLGQEALNTGQTKQLLLNSVRWTQRGGKGSVGVWAGDQNGDLIELFKANGFDATAVRSGDDLYKFSALVVNGHRLSDSDEAPLRQFLSRGGGLVMGTTGWGWNWRNESQTLSKDYFGNRLLAPYGLVWSEGTVNGERRAGKAVFTVGEVTSLASAGRALNLLEASLKGATTLSVADASLASRSISDLLTGLPQGDASMQRRFNALLEKGGELKVPTEKSPLGPTEPGARLRYLIALRQSQALPPEKIKADPAAATFPGSVPAGAKTVTKTVEVDLSVPEWHSTGLYAAPGVLINISLPREATGKKLWIRIGCHTDSLINLDSWQRSPEISRAFPLDQVQVKAANPFGGLVYIVVPDGLKGRVNVTISGAVESPHFTLGKTDVAEWKNRIRNAPGPWAELETSRAIVTVPSVNVRDIDDPTATLELYENALAAMADLRGIDRLHPYPERIVADQQISAGYMHSGYPVMTWLDVQKKSVDYALLKKESWGHWHEFGHNHQLSAWTPEGTGEVTNNLFALYVWKNVMGREDEDGHPALKPLDFEKQWRKYDAGGRNFEEWKANPFLALHCYLQLKNAFGWEPFKKVFREYEAMPEAQRPTTDQAKRDEWMIRFSRNIGRNLGPFYAAWGVPISPSAVDAVKELPTWIPTTAQTLGIETNLAHKTGDPVPVG